MIKKNDKRSLIRKILVFSYKHLIEASYVLVERYLIKMESGGLIF